MEMWQLMFPIIALMSGCGAPSGTPGSQCSLQVDRAASQTQIEAEVATALREPGGHECVAAPSQLADKSGWRRMSGGRSAYRVLHDFGTGGVRVEFASLENVQPE